MRLRILVCVTHLLGAGHLTRAAALARALRRAGHAPVLVTGGLPNALDDTGGFPVVQLPPVRAHVADFATLRDEAGTLATPERMGARRRMLLDAFRSGDPDVVVTELYPFGRRSLAAEFDALLDAAGGRRPRPLVIASIRDILAPPSRPEKAARTHRTIADRYDAVLVHGDDSLVPLEASWPVDPALRARLIYTGYIDPGAAAGRVPEGRDGEVLVSGGSSAAGLPLYRAALLAAAGDPGRRWRILVGAGVEPADRARLAAAAPPSVTVEPARPDFRDLMSNAAVFVGQAGYNTVMDIVATRPRAVLVPFEQGRETEQRLRAEALAARGMALLLPESELNPATLAAAVDDALRRRRPAFPAPRLDGARESVAAIERLAASRGHAVYEGATVP